MDPSQGKSQNRTMFKGPWMDSGSITQKRLRNSIHSQVSPVRSAFEQGTLDVLRLYQGKELSSEQSFISQVQDLGDWVVPHWLYPEIQS